MTIGVWELVIWAVLILPAYFLPGLIALVRGHANKVAILILNAVVGWTVLGWIALIAWAFIDSKRQS